MCIYTLYTPCTYTVYVHTYFLDRRIYGGSSFSIVTMLSASWTTVNSQFDSMLRNIPSFLLCVYVVSRARSVSCPTCSGSFFIGRPNEAAGGCSRPFSSIQVLSLQVLGAIASLLHTSSRCCVNYSKGTRIFAFFVEISTTEGTLIYRVYIHVYKGRRIRARHSSTVLLTPPQPHNPNPNFDSPLPRKKTFADIVPYPKIRVLKPSTIYKILPHILLFTLYIYIA